MDKLIFDRISFYEEQSEFVEFNDEKIPFKVALENAEEELQSMFEDCKTYAEATEVLFSNHDLCSEENGYIVEGNKTGNLYGEWLVVRGNNDKKTIEWDVRAY